MIAFCIPTEHLNSALPIAKQCTKKLDISVRNKEKKKALNCYVILIHLSGIECWIIYSLTKIKPEAEEMWFYSRIVRVLWTK